MKNRFGPLVARWLVLACTLAVVSLAPAGTFKRITIDGSFADWAGVPVAGVDDEGDTTGGYDLRELYIANDDQYLYLMVRIYPSSTVTNTTQVHSQFFIDGDYNPATGRADLGLGADMVVEDGYAFSQRYNHWYDGDITGSGWTAAPVGALPSYQYEARISRSARDTHPADVPTGSGNPARDLPVFEGDWISVAHGVSDSSWSRVESIAAVSYDMAPVPTTFTGTQTMVALTTTSWQANDAGADLGSDWLGAAYDDTQPGWKSGNGLFGYNAPSGVYPVPVATVLTGGRPTYYLRTRFIWSHDVNGVGLLTSNYLSAGAVYYLNGAVAKSVRMPTGTITYTTPATGGPAQPGTAELFDLPTGALIVGENILEVEVHPAAGAGSSLVFGTALIASDNFPPRIEDPTQPADRAVTEGEATTFSPGTVAGSGPFTFRWFKTGVAIPDATNATFTLDMVVETDAGAYSVEITNPKGSKITSRAAQLTAVAVPVVLTNPNLPADQTVVEGTSATFTVAATGSLLSYTWFKNDMEIVGVAGPQLTLDNVPLTETGTKYSVTVTNRVSRQTSRKATLTVVRDTVPATIAGVTGGGRTIVLHFSEPMDPASAELASSYTVDGGVTVQSASLNPATGTDVTLTTSAQQFGKVYKVTATGARDRFGNAAPTTAYFRSTILIDGNLADWGSITPLITMNEVNPGSIEYKDLSITNDDDYVYIRFRYYVPAGPLSVADWSDYGNYYHIIINNDTNVMTGGYLGNEIMVENGWAAHLGGGWTDGQYLDADVALAPVEVAADDFEFRLSRHATLQADGSPAFPIASFTVVCETLNTATWGTIARTSPVAEYTFGTLPPLPTTLAAKLVGTKIELTWSGGGVLETRATLNAGIWAPVPGAVSGIQIETTGSPAGYYRVRQ